MFAHHGKGLRCIKEVCAFRKMFAQHEKDYQGAIGK
jgi:hypothetical protein